MTRQSLEQLLAELHVQLESVDDLAAEEAAQLRSAAEDIRLALNRSGVADEGGGEQEGLLTRQWDEATQSFSRSHPVLASTIGRIADLLSQIGI